MPSSQHDPGQTVSPHGQCVTSIMASTAHRLQACSVGGGHMEMDCKDEGGDVIHTQFMCISIFAM